MLVQHRPPTVAPTVTPSTYYLLSPISNLSGCCDQQEHVQIVGSYNISGGAPVVGDVVVYQGECHVISNSIKTTANPPTFTAYDL